MNRYKIQKLKEIFKKFIENNSNMFYKAINIIIGVIFLICLIGSIFFISYFIIYCIIYGVFWVFGPVIFGYTFSYKIVIGIWLVLILINQIFKK